MILWHDSRRICGQNNPLLTYTLLEDRLFIDKGILYRQSREIWLYRIRDIRWSQTLWQRLFDEGSIYLYGNDLSEPILVIRNVKDSFHVKEMIYENIKYERNHKNIHLFEDY